MPRYKKYYFGHWIMVLCNSAFQSIFLFAITNSHFIVEKGCTITAHLLMTWMKKINWQ